jgi:hypothetical protein
LARYRALRLHYQDCLVSQAERVTKPVASRHAGSTFVEKLLEDSGVLDHPALGPWGSLAKGGLAAKREQRHDV